MAGGRIAGDSKFYEWRLVRYVEDETSLSDALKGKKTLRAEVTPHGFRQVSVSSFIGDVLAKPASAMAWWGYRIGLSGVIDVMRNDPDELLQHDDPERLEDYLKTLGVNPNMKLESAGDRGNVAHGVLEKLVYAHDHPDETVDLWKPEDEDGTEYGLGVIEWWAAEIAPRLENGEIIQVLSEVPVWSFVHDFIGTLDLAIQWADGTWTIVDLKTHKPAAGFTQPGKGPAYLSDVTQIRAYRMAFEERGLGQTIGQTVIVARDRAYRGRRWEVDHRTVDPQFVVLLRQAWDHRNAFENAKGEQDG